MVKRMVRVGRKLWLRMSRHEHHSCIEYVARMSSIIDCVSNHFDLEPVIVKQVDVGEQQQQPKRSKHTSAPSARR